MSASRRIDWSTAAVEQGSLIVHISGERPRGWVKDLRGVLAILDKQDGRWGSIDVHGDTIEVPAVDPGAEESLRHLLESALLQVKSDLGIEDDDSSEDETDPQLLADRRMAQTFRGFAS